MDYKSYLLDFKSLPLKDEEGASESGDTSNSQRKKSTDENNTETSTSAVAANNEPNTPGGHHTMEFFEMCAALITQLAR